MEVQHIACVKCGSTFEDGETYYNVYDATLCEDCLLEMREVYNEKEYIEPLLDHHDL